MSYFDKIKLAEFWKSSDVRRHIKLDIIAA